MTAEDARIALDRGVDTLFVSNDGSRHLDATFSSIEVLPEVVAAVAGQCEIHLDGGMRRGSDVLQAITPGATAVGIGRPDLWGLAVDGDAGVLSVIHALRNELRMACAFCGQTSIHDSDPGLIAVPDAWSAWRFADSPAKRPRDPR